MNKKYFSLFASIIIYIILFNNGFLYAQNINPMSLKDFNLKGPVEHCILSADYGNEEFYFDKDGSLYRMITRYGENDYTITIYSLSGENIIQKNIEVYNNGKLDKSVSLAHAYEIRINSKGTSITERIVNFKSEQLDTYQYDYNTDKRLIKIIRNNKKGIEETNIHYELEDDLVKREIYLSGADTVKVIKRLEPKIPHGKGAYEKLEIFYNNSIPDVANLKFIDSIGKVKFEETLTAGNKNPYRFYSKNKKTFIYNEYGDVVEEKSFNKKVLMSKVVYEYEYEANKDPEIPLNWLRKTDKYAKNTITREIVYY